MCFCNRSLDASADLVIYDQMTQADTRALLGDSLPFNITVDGVTSTQYFTYMSSYGGATIFNIETNPVFTNGNQSFDFQNGRWIFYYSDVDQYNYINKNVSIDMDLSLYASAESMFYGGFGLSLSNSVYTNPLSADNRINGLNYINDDFSAPAFGDASANQDYYNTAKITFQLWNNNTVDYPFRMFTYNDLDSVTSLHAEGKFYAIQRLVFAVYCPWVYGEISSSAPVTTTTTTGSALGSYDINVTVDVDLSPVVSEISGVAGEVQRVKDEVTGIATDVSNIGSLLAVDASETAANMSLEPLGTLSSIDYDHILDDADEVMEDLPNALVGTASIWAMISAFVDTNAIWLWLIPLCMLLCFLSVMLWRS